MPTPAPIERLGQVRCPSGDLVLIDFGLLRRWSGESVPAGADGPDGGTVDVELAGPGARSVADALDLALVKGRFAFDLPDGGAWLQDLVRAAPGGAGVAVAVRPPIPHAERVRLLLADDPGGVEVPFDGGWAVAVRGLPTDRALPVLGRRMPADGPDAASWHSVWVAVEDAPATASVPAGYVLVDEARLAFVDAEALGAWRTDEPADGRVDLAFWGRDGAAVAAEVGAGPLDDPDGEVFGWLDLAIEDVEVRFADLEARRGEDVRFAIDVRPHDDHHLLLAQARRTPTGSGTIAVAGSEATGFFTTWGDGAYPVFRDVDATGATVAVRVELGAPEIVARQRRFESRWFGPLAKLAMVSDHVAVGGALVPGARIDWAYREAPRAEQDSGWRVFAGDETPEETADAASIGLVPLRDLLPIDGDLEDLFALEAPVQLERGPDGRLHPLPPA